ncbi:OmpA family protein [Rhodovulum sp. DZ06]|uniref:OmpA family protein n=1 Tax=Rhodovulum sp. DZ06 TaxID=3425126 RepID=UPI003D32749C
MTRPGPGLRFAFALSTLVALGALGGVATLAPVVAERGLEKRLTAALHGAGHDWAMVRADGLEAHVRGHAPSAADRDAALLVAAEAAGAGRLTFDIIAPGAPPPEAPEDAEARAAALLGPRPAAPPPAAVMTRDGGRLAVAGRMRAEDMEALRGAMDAAGLELADAAMPAGAPADAAAWEAARDLAAEALSTLASGAAELTPGMLKITGWIGADVDRLRLERRLRRAAPEGLALELSISAPPPAFRPFRFAAMRGPEGARLQTCHVRSEAEGDAIAAAFAALPGAVAGPACRVGVGAPTSAWGEAALAALDAIAELEAARVEITDRDVKLSAAAPVRPEAFEAAARRLSVRLGPGWALTAEGPPLLTGGLDGAEDPTLWFAARHGPQGARLAGRAPDAATRAVVIAYARARLGADALPGGGGEAAAGQGQGQGQGEAPAPLAGDALAGTPEAGDAAGTPEAATPDAAGGDAADPVAAPAASNPSAAAAASDPAPAAAASDPAPALGLADAPAPPAWRRAALSGIDALAPLSKGAAAFDGARATVSGETDDPEAARRSAAALARLEAETGVKTLSVVAVDLAARAAQLPLGPARCIEALNAAQAPDPIGFEPGSARIVAGSAGVLDRLAGILKRCGGLVVEIEGHTDSQGRETTNQALSRGRAEAVLEALRRRGAPGWRMTAQGYGEARPVADNSTEEGRAANRRIAFSDGGAVPPGAPDPLADPAAPAQAQGGGTQAAAPADAPTEAPADTPDAEESAR